MTRRPAYRRTRRARRHAVLALAVAVLAAAPAGHILAQQVLTKTEIIRSLAPMAAQADAPRSIDLDIRFDVNSAGLSPGARRQLEELGQAIRSAELDGLSFRIAGHTDASGPAAYNKALSLRRAASVKRFLMTRYAIAAERLSVRGFGEERLKRPFDPTSAANRRVEISVRLPGVAGKDPVDGIIRR